MHLMFRVLILKDIHTWLGSVCIKLSNDSLTVSETPINSISGKLVTLRQ